MSEVWVWLSAIGFLIAVFPVHIFNYVYVNTGEKYASINVAAYRYFRILNVNTVKNSIDKMQINGKEKDFKSGKIWKNTYTIFNNLCLTKIVQLCDIGIAEGNNAYFALAQTFLSNKIYDFIEANGGKTKLKNYAVLNFTHDKVNYYLKLVGVINLLTIAKIIFILITEKIINE